MSDERMNNILEEARMKDIKGYEGLYAVTSCGQVWSYKRKKFIDRNPVGKMAYLQVSLYKDGERHNRLIHRLVAETYLPNPDNLPQVDHLEHDGTYHPEYLNNLAWKTRENNCCNRPNAMPVFDTLTGQSYCSISQAARHTEQSFSKVKRLCELFRDSDRRKAPPQFIYWADMTIQIFQKYFPNLDEGRTNASA